jgi:hypothetical protein
VVPCTLSARQTGSAIEGHSYWRECTESGEQPRGEQQQQQLRRSGRGQQAEQTESPPSFARSGPRTRGGDTQPQLTSRQRRAAIEELVEREQQEAHDPRLPRGPRAEAFGVYLHDLRHLPGPKIRHLRSVPEE